MKKIGFIILLTSIIMGLTSLFSFKGKPTSSIHQFKATTIDGKTLDFSSLKGKKVLIVNTASKCGFTPQYKDLEVLFEKYKDKNLVIIGFPCNQFGKQEPGNSSDIQSFCTKNYGVTFQIMEKVNVKGDSISDIYKWLTDKNQNGVMNSSVKWNFQKYLIDENGYLVDYALSFKKPDCNKIIKWLESSNSTN